MSVMQKYLHRRSGSDNWHIRLAVPNSLKTHLRKSEITKSTGTSDKKAAETFAMKFIAEQKEMFTRELSALESVVPIDINERIVALYHKKFLEELREKTREHGHSHEAYSAWCAKMKRQRDEFVRLANVENYGRIRTIAEKFVKREGFIVPTKGDEFESLLARMMIAIVDAFDVLLKRIAGELDAKPASSFVRDTIKAGKAKPSSGEQLEALLKKYTEEQIDEKGRKPANVEQAANAISLFIEWVGPGQSVRTLSKQDASGFRDVLSVFPVGRGKRKELKAASITQCIEIAESVDLPRLSPRTRNKYISDLSGFFRWLKRRGYCEENIWSDMSFHVGKEPKSYPPFSTEDLNKILMSPLYSGFLKDGKEHIAGDQYTDNWRFWIPLICMFTGARVTEIAQLYVDDISEQDGHLIGYIMADTKRGQSTKTDKSRRLVVFHPTLLAAGLATYWKQQCRRAELDGNKQLFPELTSYEKRDELGRKPARWWRGYLEKIGVKDGADGYGTHSFRHRLADEMRKAGYLDAEFGLLVMGHSEKMTTNAYGLELQGTVQRLAAMIAKAEFKGVNFTNILPRNSV